MTTTMATKPKIAIDEEFAKLMPPLDADTDARLETSILANGCTDPLTVWDIGLRLVLLDGHNRFRICQKHDLPYKIVRLQFDNRDLARDWAINHQLGRRNITDEQRTYLLGKLYLGAKPEQGRPQNAVKTGTKKPDTVSGLSASEIAEQHGVEERTVRRAADFAESVDAIGDVAPDLKDAILSGNVDASAKDLHALAEAPTRKIKSAAAKVAAGDRKAVKKVVEREPGDDTELIKAEAAKRRNSGKETVSPKERKEAIRAFGVVVRHVTKLGKRGQCADHLEAIRLIVEGKL